MLSARIPADSPHFTENTFGFVPLPPIQQVDEGNSVTFNPYFKQRKMQKNNEDKKSFQFSKQGPFLIEKVEDRQKFQADLREKMKLTHKQPQGMKSNRARSSEIFQKPLINQNSIGYSSSKRAKKPISKSSQLSSNPSYFPFLMKQMKLKIIEDIQMEYSYDPCKEEAKRSRNQPKSFKKKIFIQRKLDGFVRKGKKIDY